MKYYIQEALELEIERYGDPVAYVEGLWKKNVEKNGDDSVYKMAYCYGVSQVMMCNMVRLMQDALEKLNELHPGE